MKSTVPKPRHYLPRGILQKLANEFDLSYHGIRWRLNNGHAATIKRALELAKEHERLHYVQREANRKARVAAFRESIDVMRANRDLYVAAECRTKSIEPDSYPLFPEENRSDA